MLQWPIMGKDDGEKAGLVGQIVRPENLALLRKGDRLVVMAAGLIVVAALGGIATLPDEPLVALLLAITAMLVVAGLVVLVQWRALSLGDLEADLQALSAAGRAVNGDWWQLVHAKDHPGLTYISIAISEVAERHAMQGTSFDEHGHHTARFSSDIVAVRTSTPVELYYIWRGTVFGAEVAEIFSGLGRFRFDSVGREQRPLEGEGAFTRGTPEELSFGQPRAVELVRLTGAESRRLAEDPSSLNELAKEAFGRFGLEPGRRYSEGREGASARDKAEEPAPSRCRGEPR
ncbi:MAG: hypothetical protein OEN55_16775 [Alphaproteobacteria bacterium]|nr:hypothetical protein [Alphaproteobacteria bacterium]